MSDHRDDGQDGAGQGILTLKRKVGGGVTIIGEGTTCTGSVKGENAINVDGTLEGEVESESIVVGPTGLIKGKVVGDVVFVTGRVEGEIVADTLRLKDSAQVDGELKVRRTMAVEDGARLDCSITMSDPKPKLAAIEGKKGENKSADEKRKAGAGEGDAAPVQLKRNGPKETR